METLIPSICAGCSQTQLQESPCWPTREQIHNSRKPFTRGNQPVVQKLSCMMVLFCTSHFFMQCYKSCSCWGVSSKMCSHIRTCAEPRLRAHKRCPRKSPRTRHKLRHKLRHKFLEVHETLRTRMFQVCGHFCGHVCGHICRPICGLICGQVLRALLAGGVCEGGLREEPVAVYRSCFAEQTHTMEVLVGTGSAVASSGKGHRTRYLQVTPTKAPATKPRAPAVSHG